MYSHSPCAQYIPFLHESHLKLFSSVPDPIRVCTPCPQLKHIRYTPGIKTVLTLNKHPDAFFYCFITHNFIWFVHHKTQQVHGFIISYYQGSKNEHLYLQMLSVLCLRHPDFCLDGPKWTTAWLKRPKIREL